MFFYTVLYDVTSCFRENFLQLDIFFRQLSYEHIQQQNAYDIFALICKYCELIIKLNILFLSLNINFVLVNSADPNEMPHNAAFYLDLHCLSKSPFRGFWSTKG